MKKQKFTYKMLALAMSLCMIFTMMPMAAHATETTHTHVWSETWSTNITDHWHECTADGCTFIPNEADINKGNYGTHNYVDYKCTVCGYDCPHSLGLDYDDNNHWQRCSVEGCGYTTDIQGHDQAGEGGACSVCYYDPNNLYHEHYWTQEWTNNTTHHWHVCNGTGGADCNPADSDPEDSGYAEHSYSNDADTLCDTCSYTRTIEHTHSYTAVVTEPTCGERGYTTYTCSCNDSYVSDYVDALDHDWGDYESDGNGYHTRTCTTDSSHYQTEKCGGGTATCTEPATCSDCGATYGSLNSTNHSGGTELRDVKDATETEDGYTGDTYCLGCGYKLSEGNTIPATGNGDDDDDDHTHNYSYYKYDGTNHWKMCICGQGQAGSVKPHSLVLEGNNNGHWKECTICNYYSDAQVHVYSNDSDEICNDCGYNRHVHSFPTATCITPAVCSCGSTYGGKNPNNHAGGTEVRNAAEATIVAEGYTGDTYCLGCGSMIASGEVIPKAGVIFDGPGVEDVTFIPAEGTELPGDAEIIVNPHTPSADDLDFVVLEEAPALNVVEDLSDVPVVPQEFDDGTLYGPGGAEYTFYEKLIINGEEYYVNGAHADGRLLLFDKNGDAYWYDGNSLGQSDIGEKVIVPDNESIRINGVVYQIIAKWSGKYALWLDGKPVGAYDRMLEIFVYFNEEYAPDKVKEKQQKSNYLGTVTTGENPIDGLVSGKTYNVSVIGSNDISVPGAENVNGTITQTFTVPDALIGNKNVVYAAVHKTASGNEIGTVTLSEDGKTLTATYTVDSFSPFIVYAFVEADEPEIKTLSATIVDGSDDTTEAPDTSEPVESPQTSDNTIWYILIAVVAGAIAVASVVYGKRRKSKAKQTKLNDKE